MFRGLLVENDAPGYRCGLQQIALDRLPDGDVTVKIEYSTLNYKDALALTGTSPIVRKFPLIPGIDFSGTVEASADGRFEVGDRVVLTGFGVGEHHWGGLAERARVPADWLVKLPKDLSTWEAMAFGTAGLTSMLAVMAIEKHGITPDSGPVLVTGAGGGVGGIAIHLLDRLGFSVVAATGRTSEETYLRSLGAGEIIDRDELSSPGKPLAKGRWAAAIDNAGSHTLASVCAGLLDDGIAVACGLAQGMDLPGSVAPFILRGITLTGINSVNRSQDVRKAVWRRLAETADRTVIVSMMETLPLSNAMHHAERLLAGQVRGRLIVDCAA